MKKEETFGVRFLKNIPNYTDILEKRNYLVGYERKGWGPGKEEVGGYLKNPAGDKYESFEEFIASKPEDKPFCFWFGTFDPHRPYEKGSGIASGMSADKVEVPKWLPDSKEVREDILDYFFEVQRLDRELGSLIHILKQNKLFENTLIVITSDNGMPFPRAKANLYNEGTHMPLIMYWKGHIEGGKKVNDFVSHIDLAPTFLDAVGLPVSKEMTGKSLMPLITGKQDMHRDKVFFERERHANVRKGDLAYPSRGIRTEDFLLILNLRPERWPAGDPEKYQSVGEYGDVDDSPTKQYILKNQDETKIYLENKSNSSKTLYYKLAFAKRPYIELYNLKEDPDQLQNVADNPSYKKIVKKLMTMIEDWMKETNDPLLNNKNEDPFEKYPYYGSVPADKSATH